MVHPYFTGLGALPGAPGVSTVALSAGLGVSGDGTVVVGAAQNANGDLEAFRWTRAGGMEGLGDLPGGTFTSLAHAGSADGSVVVGESVVTGGTSTPVVWTEGGGLQTLALPLGADRGRALGVSADGSIVVGNTFVNGTRQPTIWTNGTPSYLGTVIDEGFAEAVSADGFRVVGETGLSSSNPAVQTTRWDGEVEVRMGIEGHAYGISADASTIVGTATFGSFFEAFAWADDVFAPLGVLDEHATNPGSRASDASSDGSIVVGYSIVQVGGSGENRAFIWDQGNGMRELRQVLTDEYGLDLTGWTLAQGNLAISDDGRTIIGSGLNPLGEPEAWIAFVPEPSTGLLVGLGLIGLSSYRRHVLTTTDPASS